MHLATRQPREVRALRILFVVVLMAVIWQGVVMPSQRAKNEAVERLLTARSDLNWMREHAAAAKRLSASNATVTSAAGAPLLTRVSDTANTFSLVIASAQPVAGDGLQVTLESASFTAMLLWLEQLEKEYGVVVTQLSCAKTSASGKVSATVTLQ